MGKQKRNCIVFTPSDIVNNMLDICGYEKNLFGKKVLENSCGEGQFLMGIVSRYIEDCRLNNFDDDQIRCGLEEDIVGFEIEEETYNICLRNLDNLLLKYSLASIKWNIYNADALKTDLNLRFDYIIGNPPYVSYAALKIDDREYIKQNFCVCKNGKPDYYYAFIEASINYLNDNGQLVYLIPSNFFKTRFADKLREFMLPYLSDVFRLLGKQIFNSVLTASAIIVCRKSESGRGVVNYHNMIDRTVMHISKKKLGDRWIFSSKNHDKNKQLKTLRFGDMFVASSSVATLCNDAFIIQNSKSTKSVAIEAAVLRAAASPQSMAKGEYKQIIFPYDHGKEGNVMRYSEEVFNMRFPKAADHLKEFREQLDKRSSDSSTKWFEYGRSQAIAHLNQRKLLLSTLVTNTVRIYELDECVVPYSGIYIVAKPGNVLSEAKKVLETSEFLEYVEAVGVYVNGSSRRISCRDINNYEYCQLK